MITPLVQKGAANVDLSVGDSALAYGGWRIEERPTRRTRRALLLDYVGLVSRTDASDGRRRLWKRHR